MIKEIHNEELYYRLPGYDTHQYQQHKPINMVYKTMLYLPHRFRAHHVQSKALDKWCVPLSPAMIGRKLRTLTENGYVTRSKEEDVNRYTYTKTQRYYDEVKHV